MTLCPTSTPCSGEQEADHAALDRAALTLENKIAAINPKLRPEAIREETAKLRQDAAAPIRSLAVAMNNRAEAARDLARFHSPEAERRMARFDDDDLKNATIQMATLMRLGRTPTRELIEHLRDAVAAKKLARAEAVRLEFESRDAELSKLGPDGAAARRAFSAELEKRELPDSKAATQAIGRIAQLAALGQERFTAATSGRSDPVARMTAARMAAE